ncbi:protein involved in gliding motility SprA [Oceanihabitans sediminis]|uniref:Cell surface protein SprA n=2 Tax=Oceanihabitans sediminis TaxID=1812012 RepID=A0A368P582_9FLAO|nr:cell surface protein SprA [Oceanihabitans sediminis]RBP34370.1 protein involved in gliding motility SprA [Oceanihabitans sediminis]RCU58047.1 cell surface protein SprA [Oceanihabitans sediminis]
MNTTNYNPTKTIKKQLVTMVAVLLSFVAWSQEPTPQDSTSTGYSLGNLEMPNPTSIVSKYTYDPITDKYIYTETVGAFNINYPVILTPKEYQALVAQENLRSYYKEKIDAFDGKKAGSEDEQKNLLPEFYVDSGLFETIFGSNTIEVVPQGSVEMDLGVLFSKQDNPAFSPRNRSSFTFDFDQRISLSLLGKVGTRLQVTANYDTESTFDFQNLVKLEYTPTEDDIIQKIEVGNVSMPLNSSLITGAQSLFGVKTQLQFGRTTITAVFSEQKSDTKSVIAQGGGTMEEFEFFARDYDENRHFFLAHYFRENYDAALNNYPFINTQVQITRIEAWVTNRNNRTENVRNIVALQDLGESARVGSAVNVTVGPNAYPSNKNNAFNPLNIGGAGSQLNSQIRDIATVQSGIMVGGVTEGADYAKLENARKLQEGQEYTLNTQLGYISLNQRLNNDEVLAVAFQFTVAGQVYQVGEFANDGVDATGVNTDFDGNVTGVNNNNLVLKLLKSPITSTNQPIWDLMMKNIYDTGAYQLSQEDFKLNIFYNEGSPVNYITPVSGTTFPIFNGNTSISGDDSEISETPLIRLFHLDKLNYNNDPQVGGDGFFDFVPNITVIPQNGKIVFTKVEPFGRYLFDILDDDGNPSNNEADYQADTYTNPNQEKYVYDVLYKETKTAALEEVEKNKFQIKGRYKSVGGEGIPIGAFNVPRGSVKVTAGGRVLVEGIDYTVNYQLGRVQILDEALKASNTPIQVSTENNSIFGQQSKRFFGINVEHKVSDKLLLGATYISLKERPITQKANYNNEPINNRIYGFNINYSTEVPFLTRLVNKLPNIDTDVPSNFSVSGEIAALRPGSPKGTDFQGEATSYVDDFEGSQSAIDLKSAQSWYLSSRPIRVDGTDTYDVQNITNGYNRAMLNWYHIDPIFYSNRRPSGISDDDMSGLYTSRVFINELFPQQDIAQGQTTVINTLDLAYYPNERGPYNFQTTNVDIPNGILTNPQDSWAGISRALTSTDFEQANVEYIEFWLQDPFQENASNPGGKLVFNLGNISEDIIKDGRKMYENGLPKDGNVSMFNQTDWGSVVPLNQSLIYAFDSTGGERTNQDVGYDGYNDLEEQSLSAAYAGLDDPSNDNYDYFLNREGDIFERYKRYNGVEGNSPDAFSDNNRGSTTQPDVEDINRDNTMNTIDSYFEYELDITPSDLNLSNPYIVDKKDSQVRNLPNGQTVVPVWYQFRVPVTEFTNAVGGIADLRSIRFARMYVKEFSQPTVFRFGTLDLVRSEWRRYTRTLDEDLGDPNLDLNTNFTLGVVNTLENEGVYQSPPGVEPEELYNNNTVIRQNEQSLVVKVCDLESHDARAVYKNINVDMRQYKQLKMFMHAEMGEDRSPLADGELVGFVRMGNDLTQNYYQIEVPLKVSTGTSRSELWPEENELNIRLEILQQIKAKAIADNFSATEATFYDVVDGGLSDNPVPEYASHTVGQQRVAIFGNPNFGDIRTLMIGVKNATSSNRCGQIWFNELRLAEMDNEGGWATVVSADANIADFANLSATGRYSTSGFGSIEQGPQERSIEDVKQYDVVTNVNVGQLLPKKWGMQIPFNYGQGEESITPKYDKLYEDIELQTRIDAASTTEEQETIKEQSETYTKRKSINFIGVRKNRTTDKTPRFYDVENLTLSYSYNKVEHRDFEIERSLDQQVRAGVNYAYNFNPLVIEPFKKNDSLFNSKYLKLLKDFNVSLLPSSFTVNTNYTRQFNKQKFRDVDLGGANIGLEELYRRNYNFDFQYTINYNLTKALSLDFTASNNNIVRNYFVNDELNGRQDSDLDVWDGFFDFGDPNRQYQKLGVNYKLPLNKIPTFSFIDATYTYSGEFQWQKGSDLFGDLQLDGKTYDLGNSISNANQHNINASLDMNKLYKYIGLEQKRGRANSRARTSRATPPGAEPNNRTQTKKSSKLGNFGIGLITSVKRIQLNYNETNGTYLPGYLQTPGFIGTLKPTVGYTFGSQRDIRELAARNGWLTQYPEFNQQYTETTSKQFDYSINVEPFRDLKIDIVGNRIYAENFAENFNVNSDLEYQSLTPNSFGNFTISSALIKTAFSKSDEIESKPFEDFRENRLIIAERLAEKFYGNTNYTRDAEGFPEGFGKSSQAVLLPAFLAAYKGQDAGKTKTTAFRNIPVPNWDLKYAGFMKLNWFKKRFKRFSLSHGYRSAYTINQFRSNLDYTAAQEGVVFANQPADALDQNGDFKNKELYSNINLTEMFSPLFRIDFESKSDVKVLLEMKKDRMLSLSFDNNLVTEIQGKEYKVGLGYRIKDVRMKSKLAGPRKTIISDINLKADVSYRDNKTIIRYLDLNNNQITSGQSLWSTKFTADYAFSKNLTGIFYFDYTFSEYAISTAFPQTSIRSGLTLRYNFGN